MHEELLDFVDAYDSVIGTTTRGEIYKKKLMHRIAHVFVFNSAGEMGLQLRAATVSFCPLHWSTTVGGHMHAGESYEQAALREMQEEIGVQLPLVTLGVDLYDKADGHQKFLGSFRATSDGPFLLNPDEVADVRFLPVQEVLSMADRGEPMHPELLFLLDRYFRIT